MSSGVRTNGPAAREVALVPERVALAGLIAGILVGCADVLVGVARAPESWTGAAEILSPLAVMSALGFGGFLALWYGVGVRVARKAGLPRTPSLAATCAFFVTAFFLLSAVVGMRTTMLSGSQLLTTVVVLVASGAIAHGVYVLLRTERHRERIVSIARRGCQAAPAVTIAALAVTLWWNPYRVSSPHGAIGLAIAAAGCGLILFRAPARAATTILAVVMAVCVVSGGVALFERNGFLEAMPAGSTAKNHRIPRVILISVDSLRVDAISHYNAKSPPTPNIDKLAAESVVFRRAYGSAAWTLPSTVSLLTGLPSFAHRVYWMNSPLPDEIPTIADVMTAAGYRTGAVVENPVLDPRLNLFHGFQQYAHYPKAWPWSADSLGRQALAGAAPSKFHRGGTEAVTRMAQEWVSTNRNSDFFFWVHYLDPHAPYTPPARFLPARKPPSSMGFSFNEHAEVVAGTRMLSAEEREWVRQLYLSEVRYVDEQIGLLLDTLKQLGLYDDSLIVMTSDHGEEFWEHGGYQHGHSMYDEVLAVPLLVKLPGSTAKGDLTTRVSTQFVMPTILDLCGIPHRNSCHSTPSLAALVSDTESSRPDVALLGSGSCYQENIDAVIFRNFKLIRRIDSNREELYDLDSDPDERRSLLETAPALAEVGRRTLNDQSEILKRVRECYHASDRAAPANGQERIQQLRSLGYLN